jgi:hypothetical protein
MVPARVKLRRMSEVPSGPLQFDFTKPFSYVFEDPRWPQKVGFGGLFYLLGFILIGWFFLLGYVAQTTRNVVAGVPHPLPEWEDLGEFFTEGARLIGVILIWSAPFLIISMAVAIPAVALDVLQNRTTAPVEFVAIAMMACFGCLLVPLGIAWLLLMPVSLLFAIVERRFGAAFELGRIVRFIRDNVGNYLFAILVLIIARLIAAAGFGVLCIGVIFTAFWALMITAHAFGQVYRTAVK